LAPRPAAAAEAAKAPPIAAPAPEVGRNELVGRVLGPLGAAAGARVTLRTGPARGFSVADMDAPEAEVLAETICDGDGAFRLALERGLVVDVHAELGPMLAAEAPDRHAGQFVELVLSEGRVVRGIVTSAEDGSPIDGASVRVFRSSGTAPAAERLSASNADGSYRITVPFSGAVAITATHPEAGQSETRLVTFESDGSAREDLALSAGVVVEGFVLDAENGEPIAGATVATGWTLEHTATTGARGDYRLPNCGPENL